MIPGVRAAPDVILHLGAHRTGTTSLQILLASAAGPLAQTGTALLLPPRPGHRDAVTVRDVLRASRDIRKARGMVSAGLARFRARRRLAGLLRAELGEATLRRVIVSEEMLLGPAFARDGTALYPAAGSTLQAFAALLPGPVREIHLTVRAYASFIVSVYAMRAVYAGTVAPFDEIRARLASPARGWPEVVKEIAVLFPGVPVKLSRFETTSVAERASSLVPDLPADRLTAPDRVSNVAPTVEAIEAALRLGRRPDDPDALVAEFAGGTRFAPLHEEEQAALEARYLRDLDRLAEMTPGIVLS